jgi:hypothetical protein
VIKIRPFKVLFSDLCITGKRFTMKQRLQVNAPAIV